MLTLSRFTNVFHKQNIFPFWKMYFRKRRKMLMKRMINKLGYSYSSSESLSLSEQSYFYMDKTKQTEKSVWLSKAPNSWVFKYRKIKAVCFWLSMKQAVFFYIKYFKRDLTLTLIGCIIDNVKSIITFGVCWNWYTERPQKPLDKYPCGFDSRHADQYGSLVQMVHDTSFSRS